MKDEPYTEDQLRAAWSEFTQLRRKMPAEFLLLSQEYEVRNENQVVVHLHNSIHESIFATLRSELGTFLRERLKNTKIQLLSELRVGEEKNIPRGAREQFEYLMQKNPMLKEMKDRFSLDTDF